MTHPAIAAGAAALRALPRFRFLSQRDAEDLMRVGGDAMLADIREPSERVLVAHDLAFGFPPSAPRPNTAWAAGIDAVRQEIQEDRG